MDKELLNSRLTKLAESLRSKVDWEAETEKHKEFSEKTRETVERIAHLKTDELLSDQLDKKAVFRIGKMTLYHYLPTVEPGKINPVPLLCVYALINRQYMMDIQPDRSVIKHFLDGGLDVYVIDWGYPADEDEHFSLEDYIEWYLNACVDFVRSFSGKEKINLLGVCQGGVISTIYTSLHQEKIQNVVTMVTPVNFASEDALLFRWCKYLDLSAWADNYSALPGSVLNCLFMYMKPVEQNISKYISMIERSSDEKFLGNFLRMEVWNYDCPNQTIGMLKQFFGDLFQDNKIMTGDFSIGGKRVNLKELTCPVLCLCAEYDHIVPYSATAPLLDLVGSEDKEFVVFQTGHIGMYVATSSQNTVSPKIITWLNDHTPELSKTARV